MVATCDFCLRADATVSRGLVTVESWRVQVRGVGRRPAFEGKSLCEGVPLQRKPAARRVRDRAVPARARVAAMRRHAVLKPHAAFCTQRLLNTTAGVPYKVSKASRGCGRRAAVGTHVISGLLVLSSWERQTELRGRVGFVQINLSKSPGNCHPRSRHRPTTTLSASAAVRVQTRTRSSKLPALAHRCQSASKQRNNEADRRLVPRLRRRGGPGL